MNMNEKDSNPTGRRIRAIVAPLVTLARSWQVGLVFGAIALLVVGLRWPSMELDAFAQLQLLPVVGSAATYGFALLTLGSFLWRPDRSWTLVGSGMAAQLLKYVPGSIWQAQRLLAVGGAPSVGEFAAVAAMAAGIGMGVSGSWFVGLVGLLAALAVVAIVVRLLGVVVAVRIGLAGLAVVSLIVVSGALLGIALGLDSLDSGQTVVAAWGVGVLAVPVPAGIGVRELYFSLAEGGETGVQLAIAHRTLTLFVDVAVGSVGLWLSSRRVPSAASDLPEAD